MDLYHTSRPFFQLYDSAQFLFPVNSGVASFIINCLFQVCLNFECGVLKDDDLLSTKQCAHDSYDSLSWSYMLLIRMPSSKRNTHTPFSWFFYLYCKYDFPEQLTPTKWAGAWLFHSTYFQRVLSNNIMIFASDKLQVRSHLLVPHKNNHIKIWTHNPQIPLLAIMIFINAINWVCAFQLTYFKELLWMVKPNKHFFSLQLFYFIFKFVKWVNWQPFAKVRCPPW